jgi:hypothetical protein
MSNEKRLVTVVAVVLVICALLSCNATPVVEALTATTLTIATNNTTPALNQQFTLSGTLKAGTTPLSGKPITLRRMDLSGQWSTISTTTTDTNGNYTFTRSESVQGTYSYYASFAGDTTYSTASSPFVTPSIGTYTATTITASKTSPAIGETVTFTVTLKSGTTLLSKPVKIWHSYPGGARSEDGTHTTSASGVYTFTQAFGSSGERVYHVEFAGDSMYASSSGAVTVNVAPG